MSKVIRVKTNHKIIKEFLKLKEAYIFENKYLENFFIKHQINIRSRIDQIINLGIPEEYLEEYMISIVKLSKTYRINESNFSLIDSLLVNKVHIQNFLQVTEGRKMTLLSASEV